MDQPLLPPGEASEWRRVPSPNRSDNTTQHMSPPEGGYRHEDEAFYFYLWKVATPCAFFLISVVGTVCNGLVVYVITSRPPMRSATNALVANLALADISFLVVCVPFCAYKYMAATWRLSDVTCQLVQYLLYVTAYVTIYTLAAISALRFLVVVRSWRTPRQRLYTGAQCGAALIWVASLAANVPTLLAHRVKTVGPPDDPYTYCGVRDELVGRVLVSFFVVGYALPLGLISVLYAVIVLHLRARPATSLDASRVRARTTRTLRVVLLVVAAFCVCWLPTHAQSLAVYLGGPLPSGRAYEVLRVLWQCMAYGNSCANPLIFQYGSKEFRRCFHDLCCPSWGGRVPTSAQGEDGGRRGPSRPGWGVGGPRSLSCSEQGPPPTEQGVISLNVLRENGGEVARRVEFVDEIECDRVL